MKSETGLNPPSMVKLCLSLKFLLRLSPPLYGLTALGWHFREIHREYYSLLRTAYCVLFANKPTGAVCAQNGDLAPSLIFYLSFSLSTSFSLFARLLLFIFAFAISHSKALHLEAQDLLLEGARRNPFTSILSFGIGIGFGSLGKLRSINSCGRLSMVDGRPSLWLMIFPREDRETLEKAPQNGWLIGGLEILPFN